jgi:hypothetical protein
MPLGMQTEINNTQSYTEEVMRTVSEFLWFIRERQLIKLKKDLGLPRPWTTDPVLHETRFTNIDRNDDFGTKSLFTFVRGLDFFSILFYVVLYRSAYSSRHFLSQMTGNWKTDLQMLTNFGIKNLGPNSYQLYLKKGQTIGEFLVLPSFDVVQKLYHHWPQFQGTTLLDAAHVIAGLFKHTHGKHLIFLGTEIAKDLSELYPSSIDPHSICPMNTGAQKGLRLLMNGKRITAKLQHLYMKTQMNPTVLEHSLCEFSKWHIRTEHFRLYHSFAPRWLYKPTPPAVPTPVVKPKPVKVVV